MMASKNRFKHANFEHGFFLNEGKNVKRNIEDAINLYKEASSFNNQYSKNNLGIIYKNGFGEAIKKNLGKAIEYFNEAIKQSNDPLSMYNLAHIYLYNESIKINISELVELLIISSDELIDSLILLCLILTKHFNFNIEAIKQEIEKHTNDIKRLTILRNIYLNGFLNKSFFDCLYNIYKTRDFLYNIRLKAIQSSYIQDIQTYEIISTNTNAKEISFQFYEGFGNDLLQSS